MDVTVIIVAYYLTIMTPAQDYPRLLGPYESRNDCQTIEQFIKKLAYVTEVPYISGGCSMMSVPQVADLLIFENKEGSDK